MRFRQRPEDKLAFVQDWQRHGARVVMIGDGLNDAGSLAAADTGIAVSDDTACLVPACDAVIHGGAVRRLPEFLTFARRARQVIVACFAVSLAYNAIGLGLALTGQLTPLATAVLMPVSSLTIIGLSAGATRWLGRRAVPPCS
jgi:Cu+-exporting ATPase